MSVLSQSIQLFISLVATFFLVEAIVLAILRARVSGRIQSGVLFVCYLNIAFVWAFFFYTVRHG